MESEDDDFGFVCWHTGGEWRFISPLYEGWAFTGAKQGLTAWVMHQTLYEHSASGVLSETLIPLGDEGACWMCQLGESDYLVNGFCGVDGRSLARWTKQSLAWLPKSPPEAGAGIVADKTGSPWLFGSEGLMALVDATWRLYSRESLLESSDAEFRTGIPSIVGEPIILATDGSLVFVDSDKPDQARMLPPPESGMGATDICLGPGGEVIMAATWENRLFIYNHTSWELVSLPSSIKATCLHGDASGLLVGTMDTGIWRHVGWKDLSKHWEQLPGPEFSHEEYNRLSSIDPKYL